MKGHPSEERLALYAGGESSGLSRYFSRYFMDRHVRECRECTASVARFEMVRAELAEMPEPAVDWNSLLGEMRANIHLGLEAGECVRAPRRKGAFSPRLAVAFASLGLIIGAGFLMKNSTPEAVKATVPVLESTGSGLELRNGASSLTILNHDGAVASQTVSAQGEIGARYIDRDTGAVTINNVYLE